MAADEVVKTHQEAISNKLGVASYLAGIIRYRGSDSFHHCDWDRSVRPSNPVMSIRFS